MRFTSAVAAGLAAVGAMADGTNYLGFNSGATLADRSAKFKQDFVDEFKTAAKLKNAPGDFNAVRLYTNIQAYSEEDPIQAFDAAVETKTKVLLGIWASGVTSIDKEIRALKAAVDKFGSDLTDLVIGINIGSEDLYRVSATGIKNKSGLGNSPKAIVGFIDDFRKAFKGTALSSIPVGHADTWDAWGNSTNSAVIDAVDFLSVHEYPYYESDKGNDISNAGELFDKAYNVALDVAGDKPVWVTETGWPYIGETWDEAVASIPNAKKYWQEVGCRKLFGKTPTFWYTLRDSNPDNEMKFAITDDLSTTPRFDLTCPKTFDTDEDKDEDKDEDSTKTSEKPKPTGSDDEKDEDDDESSSEPSSTAAEQTTMTTAGSSSTAESTGSGASSTPTGEAESSESEDPDSSAASLKVGTIGILAAVAGIMALF